MKSYRCLFVRVSFTIITIDFDNRWRWRNEKPLPVSIGLGLGLQGLYSATNCADNILGRFTIIHQNQIARVDSFTNLIKRWVFRFRLNASISSHNLISFGKQFHARGPYTANARLPKVSCLNLGTFRTRSSLDLMEYILLLNGVIFSWMQVGT